MSEKDNDTGFNIIQQIKKLLINFDLAIEYAKSEIDFHDESIKLYSHSQSPLEKKLFVSHKIDKEKFEIYKQELEKEKSNLMVAVNSVLDKYHPNYKSIFVKRFFECKQLEEIADETGYSVSGVKKVINTLKNDFIDIDLSK